MTGETNGVLAIWHGIAPENWSDTIAWYDREHHAERVDIPGFVSARRHLAVDASPALFIRYRTMSSDVLSSEEYMARADNPTPLSRERQPTIIDNSRIVCRVAGRVGRGEGGYVLTARLTYGPENAPSPSSDAASAAMKAVDWGVLSEKLVSRWGIPSAEIWVSDAERTGLSTGEMRLRPSADRVADVIVVVHGTEEEPLRGVMAEALNAEKLQGAWAEATIGLYRVAFSL